MKNILLSFGPVAHRERRSSYVIKGMAAALAGVALVAVPYVSVQAMTLEESVRIAIESHPTVLAAQAAQRVREKQVDEARAPFFPDVNGRAASGYERTNSPGTRGRASRGPASIDSSVEILHTDSNISVRQMVFDGFETINRTDAARTRVEAAGHQIRDSEEEIALRAAQAYLSVLEGRDVVELADENVRAHVEVLDDVRLRAQQGGGSIADVRQAEARLALAQTRLTELRGDLRDAESDFIEAVGTVPDDLELPEPPEDAMPAAMEEAVEKSVAGSPAIRAAAVAVAARRTDIEASNGVFYPRFDIELTAARNHNIQGSRGLEQNYQAFGVVRWNLFRGGADLARKRRLTELASQSVQLEAETKRLTEEQMRVDFNALQVSQDRLPTLEDRVLAADQVVVAYRQQFQLGQRTLLDVLDVENELFQARVALVQGEFDLRDANYRVLATMGALGPTLGAVAAAEE
jgi:adhesin transport system outer membrane protein